MVDVCVIALDSWIMVAFIKFLNYNLDSQSDTSSATSDIVREARQQVLLNLLLLFWIYLGLSVAAFLRMNFKFSWVFGYIVKYVDL